MDRTVPAEQDGPLIGLVNASKNLQKAAFARPVFAHEAVDLSWQEFKIHSIQRLHSRKLLNNSPKSKDRLFQS